MPLLNNLFSSLNMAKTKPPPNIQVEDSSSSTNKPYNKTLYINPQKPNKGLSFFAFLFSISIYISIFFIFNLSPSSLFNNTKFMFIISNTLIIIIAADYGTFSSSSRNKQDLYDNYVAANNQPRTISSLSSQYIDAKKVVLDSQESFQDKKMIVPFQETENPSLEIVVKSDPMKLSDRFQEKAPNDDKEAKKMRARTYRRRKSEKARKAMMEEIKNQPVLKRSESERRNPVSIVIDDEEEDEENEFSSMSNEELNKRVEEFIQRFNRQIRLQRLEAADKF